MVTSECDSKSQKHISSKMELPCINDFNSGTLSKFAFRISSCIISIHLTGRWKILYAALRGKMREEAAWDISNRKATKGAPHEHRAHNKQRRLHSYTPSMQSVRIEHIVPTHKLPLNDRPGRKKKKRTSWLPGTLSTEQCPTKAPWQAQKLGETSASHLWRRPTVRQANTGTKWRIIQN